MQFRAAVRARNLPRAAGLPLDPPEATSQNPPAAMLLHALLLFLPSPQATSDSVHEVEALADGSILVAAGGDRTAIPRGIVFRIARDGTLLHAWQAPTLWTHSAAPTSGGAVLVTDTDNDRLLEIAADGTVLWDSDAVAPFSDGSRLRYPNDAEVLPDGTFLVSDRDNHRVLQIDRSGTVLWQYGVTGVPGSGPGHLRGPHNPERLPSGNTLIADSGNDRVLEVDPAGAVVWSWSGGGAGGLAWPRDADLISTGEILITDSRNDRLLVVDRGGSVRLDIPVRSLPYDADELPGGTFLVGGGSAYEVDSTGAVLWEWPDQRPPVVRSLAVHNPSTGVDLAVVVHLPADASAADPRPAIVHVPGGSGAGGGFYADSEDWARAGWIGVHFDPDGRGASTNGGAYTVEDYDGFLQQDGLHEVLRAVAALPEVDPGRLVVYSFSYGITMASGALARYPDDPPVAVLVDWEGPASRAETAAVNGGHVPVDPGDDLFWSEREAITFLPGVRSVYLRLQSAVDHHPPHPGNFHAIDLADAALRPFFGGGGASPWVLVGGELDNPQDRSWTLADPPAWIPEDLDEDPYMAFRVQRELTRILFGPLLDVGGALTPGGTALVDLDGGSGRAGRGFQVAASAAYGPLARPGGGWLDLAAGGVLARTLSTGTLDAAGRAFLAWAIPPAPGLAGRDFLAQAVVLEAELPVPTAATPPQVIPIR